jgi:hypothetical protein
LGDNNFYQLSPEWKHTLLKWIYEFQDSTTGLWGPKDRKTKKIVKYDVNNTASILKNFRDKNGDNLYNEFPLKYQDKLFKTTLDELSEPVPDAKDLDEIHEWNLKQCKGIQMLLRYVWNGASAENRTRTEAVIKKYLDISFSNYFIENEGAFSYYPHAQHASLDGSSVLIFNDIGAYSARKQKKLWGNPQINAKHLGEVSLNEIKTSDLNPLTGNANINSLRIYSRQPAFDSLTNHVWAVYYPKATVTLDVVELIPRMTHWIDSVKFSMGNWSTRENIKKGLSALKIKKSLVYKSSIPFGELNKKLAESSTLYVIGFDKLQIPRGRMIFRYEN